MKPIPDVPPFVVVAALAFGSLTGACNLLSQSGDLDTLDRDVAVDIDDGDVDSGDALVDVGQDPDDDPRTDIELDPVADTETDAEVDAQADPISDGADDADVIEDPIADSDADEDPTNDPDAVSDPTDDPDTEVRAETCYNEVDSDGDGLLGCNDPDCDWSIHCIPNGAVEITEFLYNPGVPLADSEAEWIELHNVMAHPVDLSGCTIGNTSMAQAFAPNIESIRPMSYLLLARSDNAEVNGLLEPELTFDFALGNSARGDTIALRCDEQLIDEVVYGVDNGFPDAPVGTAVQVSGRADSNEVAGSWCLATTLYYQGPMEDDVSHYGTPGSANADCVD